MPDPQPHHVADLLQRLVAWEQTTLAASRNYAMSPGDVAVLIRTLHAYEVARKDAERLDFVQSQIGAGKWGCYYVIARLDSGQVYFRPANNLHGQWWAHEDEANGPFHTIRAAIDAAAIEVK